MKYPLTVVRVIGVAILFCGGAAGQASAGPPVVETVDCDSVYTNSTDQTIAGQLYNLCKATDATWFKSAVDKEGLKGKVVWAASKVWEGKVSDAEQKLSDYEYKLELLISAAKPKVDVKAAEEELKPRLLAVQKALCNC